MNKNSIFFWLTIAMLFVITVCSSIVIDNYLHQQKIKEQVAHASDELSKNLFRIIDEFTETMDRLPHPAVCDQKKFRKLIYRHLYIKNIGVMGPDNTIKCDAYSNTQESKKISEHISTLTTDEGTIKYWYSKKHLTIALPENYFIELDTRRFLNFQYGKLVSGMYLLRVGHNPWFEYHQHNLPYKSKKHIFSDLQDKSVKIKDLNKFNGNGEGILSYSLGNAYIYIQKISDDTISVVFSDKTLSPGSSKLRLLHLTLGIIVGFILSLLYSKIYKRRFAIHNMLAADIRKKKLFMVYQPLVDIQDQNKIVGFEALARWRNSFGELVRPDIFIPIAEKYRLTHDLTTLIIDNVFIDLHETLKKHPSLYVGINITPSDLHDDRMSDLITDKIKEYGLTSDNIVVELTERIVADNRAQFGINELKKAGMKISIDDFGTGASNVKYLGDLKPDIIKIDRTFIEWSDSEGPTSTLFKELVRLSKHFEVKIVAEGVETQAQADRCLEYGADVGQGYFWYKPLDTRRLKEQFPDFF